MPHRDGSTTEPQQEGGPGLLSSAPSTSPSHIVVTEKIACVLIIEDNLINQKVLKRQLSQRAYDTLVANNGQEALDLLTSDEGNSVSVALMDVSVSINSMEAFC